MNSESSSCTSCGAPIESGHTGSLCLACLASGISTLPDPQASPVQGFTPPEIEELNAAIEDYEITGLLGRGGMGAVYLAKDSKLNRQVAIKILPRELSARDPSFVRRFEDEAKRMAALNHPNIVGIYQFGQTREGDFYFAMEYVDGPSLWQLRKAREIPPDEALFIVREVCRALQAAHLRNIVHRDITPGNILLNSQGHVKVTDFGLAKLTGDQGPGVTRTNEAAATVGFSPPEQRSDFANASPQTDLYAVGAVLYFILTGTTPVGAWVPPSSRTQVSKQVDRLVHCTLDQNPANRPKSAFLVLQELDRILSAKPARPKLAYVIAAAAVLVLTVTLVLGLRGKKEDPASAQSPPASPSPTSPPDEPGAPSSPGPVSDFRDLQAKYRQRLAKATEEADFDFHERRQVYISEVEKLEKQFADAGNEEARRAVELELDTYDSTRNATGVQRQREKFEKEGAPLLPAALVTLQGPFFADAIKLLEDRRDALGAVAQAYAAELDLLASVRSEEGALREATVARLEAERARRNPDAILQQAGTVIVVGDERHGVLTRFPEFGDDVIAVDAGRDHCLALTNDGRVFSWGLLECAHAPRELSNVIMIAAGVSHNIALTADGTLVEWGVLTEKGGRRPVGSRVPKIAEPVVSICAGENFSAALDASGKIHVWGRGDEFQPPASLSSAVQLDAGRHGLIALRPDGSPVSWGHRGVESMQFRHAVSAVMGKASHAAGIYLSSIGRRVLIIDSWTDEGETAELIHENSKGIKRYTDSDQVSALLKNDGTVVPYDRTRDLARFEGVPSIVEMAAGYHDLCLIVFERRVPESERKATPPPAPATEASPVPGKRFTNSLGITLRAVPDLEGVLFAERETLVSDFASFSRSRSGETPRSMFALTSEGWIASQHTWNSPGFVQESNHPVVGVGFSDAKRFCNWLTTTEQEGGLIPSTAHYRLPSDYEWGALAGLKEFGGTPTARIALGKEPPLVSESERLKELGNFAGEETSDLGIKLDPIPGHTDKYPYTAPVSELPEDENGFRGIFGNVWEWCDDFHGQERKFGVVRGMAWSTGGPLKDLKPSGRLKVPSGGIRQDVGFRILLDHGSVRVSYQVIAQDTLERLRHESGLSPRYGMATYDSRGIGMHFNGIAKLEDLMALKSLPLASLHISETGVRDLSPVAGCPLEDVDLGETQIEDITALRGAPLKFLNLDDTNVTDLSPLADAPLVNLSIIRVPAEDFSFLEGRPLDKLFARGTTLQDLNILKGMKLRVLSLHDTPVTDLSPLVGVPLVQLVLAQTRVSDLSPLADMPLNYLVFHPERIEKGLEVLLELEDLESIYVLPKDADLKTEGRKITREELHESIRTGDWNWEE